MKTILVIEDNDEIRENTSEMLELAHYRVLTSKEGNSGYHMARKYNPDLILCDIMMPKTDGRAFLRMAKADELLRNTPIVFFSAGSAQDLQKELKKIADGFLKKPFTEQELFSTINTVLEAGKK
jgi:CRP/FNR family transcriptional regulator, cyclic AMP receptor protein